MTDANAELEAIADRFGMALPDDFRKAYRRGLLTPGSDCELLLSDLRWLTPTQIVQFVPLEFQVSGLIPFARNARRDLWCWHTQWEGPVPNPIVFCPRDSSTAEVFAQDFSAALYRMLLEELSSTSLPAEDSLADRALPTLVGHVEAVADLLPPGWVSTLREIVQRPLRRTEDGAFEFLARSNADAIIERDLGFSGLNQEFPHYR